MTTTYIGNYFEWTGNTSTMKRYYYAAGVRVAMRTGTAEAKWLLGDHLGSQSYTVSYAGTSEEGEVRYKPWGEERYTSGTTPTSFRYTGQRSEAALGIYFYGARWYDPALGRFLQADTLVPNPNHPQDWDRYSYVRNNPVRYNDPSGHTSACAGANADPECRHVNFNGYNRWIDLNHDGEISQEEAEVEFVRNLRSPGEGLTSGNNFGADCTTIGCAGGQHAAVDFYGDPGTTPSIEAAYSGFVVDVDDNPKGDFGMKVVIEHTVFGYRFFSIYAHLSATTAVEGRGINTGDQVGFMGNTPFDSGTIHLHFEVRKVLNVELDDSGDYVSLPGSAESYWADSYEEMSREFVNIGPRFGYDDNYPANWLK